MIERQSHRTLRFILSLKDFLSLLLGAGTGPGLWLGLTKPCSAVFSGVWVWGFRYSRGARGWTCGFTSRTPSGAFFRLRVLAPPAPLRWSCWMMAENLASSDGLPVLDLVAGREVQMPEFSFSWYGTGGGGRRGAGRGGLAAWVDGA